MSVFTGHMNCLGTNSKLNATRKREHRQNAIQYLYLHLFTTKFFAILLTLTQKCHISRISNVQKVRQKRQQTEDELNKASVWSGANNTNQRLIFLKFDYRKYSNILLHVINFEMDIGKGVLAIDIYNFIRAKHNDFGGAVLSYIAGQPRSHECTRTRTHTHLLGKIASMKFSENTMSNWMLTVYRKNICISPRRKVIDRPS